MPELAIHIGCMAIAVLVQARGRVDVPAPVGESFRRGSGGRCRDRHTDCRVRQPVVRRPVSEGDLCGDGRQGAGMQPAPAVLADRGPEARASGARRRGGQARGRRRRTLRRHLLPRGAAAVRPAGLRPGRPHRHLDRGPRGTGDDQRRPPAAPGLAAGRRREQDHGGYRRHRPGLRRPLRQRAAPDPVALSERRPHGLPTGRVDDARGPRPGVGQVGGPVDRAGARDALRRLGQRLVHRQRAHRQRP